MKKIFQYIIQLIFLATFSSSSAYSIESNFLPVDDAFRFVVEQNGVHLNLSWKVVPGYKLYKEKMFVRVIDGSIDLGKIDWPNPSLYFDRTFNKNMMVYKESINLNIPIKNLVKDAVLEVSYQGCADEGLCYPPVTKTYAVISGNLGQLKASENDDNSENQKISNAKNDFKNSDDLNIAQEILKSEDFLKIALGFGLFGLLLSFTPCVLPMIPILSSIIVGNQKSDAVPAKGFLMALAYCAGMALIYTSMGLMAGVLGEGLAGYLQQPWVLVLFASMLLIFSLSMFDVFSLQMPSFVNERLNQVSACLPGGKFFGVFLMGALSALMVGPCVAGPLAGALIYISQTKNLILGGVALFSMALGMSVPLLATGLSAGKLLPKAGPWMVQVKHIFGLLLLTVALWMVTPLMSDRMTLLAWGSIAIFAALYLDLFNAGDAVDTFGKKLKKLLAILVFLIGVAEVWGAISGSTNLLKPLGQAQSTVGVETKKLNFVIVKNTEELDGVLRANKKVLIDFYADWCISCKEMEAFTFSEPNVYLASQGITLVQIDVTKNNSKDREILKRFGLFGPPAILFINENGQEEASLRVLGFMNAEKFSQRLLMFKKS